MRPRIVTFRVAERTRDHCGSLPPRRHASIDGKHVARVRCCSPGSGTTRESDVAAAGGGGDAVGPSRLLLTMQVSRLGRLGVDATDFGPKTAGFVPLNNVNNSKG